MSVFRKRVTKSNFTVVQNELLYDPNMSAKTKWLIIYCLSKPDGWDFASHRIAKETKDGRDAILSAMKEARAAGWMKVYNERQPDGSLTKTTEVTDSPWDFSTNDPDIADLPKSGNPTTVDPTTVDPTTVNPDSKKELIQSNTEVVRTKEPRDRFSSSSAPSTIITGEDSTDIKQSQGPRLSYPSSIDGNGADPSLITPNTAEGAAIVPGGEGGSTVPPSSTGRPALGPQVREVFQAWVQIMGKTAGAKLNDKRRSKIEARLREGYTVQELIAAVEGARANPWMMGDNDRGTTYDDIVTILRDGAAVERHRDFEPVIVPPRKPSTMDQFRDLERKLRAS